MSSWNDFVEIVLHGKYFLIFIAILMIIIASIIIYLIKLQITSSFSEYEDDELNEEKREVKEKKETEKPILVQSQFNFNNEELDNNEFVVSDDVLEKTQELKEIAEDISKMENKEYEHIEQYEKEQEENAIISYEELSKRKNDIETVKIILDDEITKNYEEEQEEKAIISYEELLEKASGTVLASKDESVPGIKITRVAPVNKGESLEITRPYYKEEEFLKTLKEFRASL